VDKAVGLVGFLSIVAQTYDTFGKAMKALKSFSLVVPSLKGIQVVQSATQLAIQVVWEVSGRSVLHALMW
jgi:hypothetical protein